MMKHMKTKNENERRIVKADGKWAVVCRHYPTGIWFGADCSPRFPTREQARDYMRRCRKQDEIDARDRAREEARNA